MDWNLKQQYLIVNPEETVPSLPNSDVLLSSSSPSLSSSSSFKPQLNLDLPTKVWPVSYVEEDDIVKVEEEEPEPEIIELEPPLQPSSMTIQYEEFVQCENCLQNFSSPSKLQDHLNQGQCFNLDLDLDPLITGDNFLQDDDNKIKSFFKSENSNTIKQEEEDEIIILSDDSDEDKELEDDNNWDPLDVDNDKLSDSGVNKETKEDFDPDYKNEEEEDSKDQDCSSSSSSSSFASENVSSASSPSGSNSSHSSTHVKSSFISRKRKSKSGQLRCPVCSQFFKLSAYLRRHMSSVHPEVLPFACPLNPCEMKFESKEQLISHMATQRHDRPRQVGSEGERMYYYEFRCWQCPRTFGRRSPLLRHLEEDNCDSKIETMVNVESQQQSKSMQYRCTEKGCQRLCYDPKGIKAHLIHFHKRDPTSVFLQLKEPNSLTPVEILVDSQDNDHGEKILSVDFEDDRLRLKSKSSSNSLETRQSSSNSTLRQTLSAKNQSKVNNIRVVKKDLSSYVEQFKTIAKKIVPPESALRPLPDSIPTQTNSLPIVIGDNSSKNTYTKIRGSGVRAVKLNLTQGQDYGGKRSKVGNEDVQLNPAPQLRTYSRIKLKPSASALQAQNQASSSSNDTKKQDQEKRDSARLENLQRMAQQILDEEI